MTRRILVVVSVFAAVSICPAVSSAATTTAEEPYVAWISAAKMPPLPELEVVTTQRCIELGAEPDLGCTDMSTFIALDSEAGPGVFLHEEGHVFAARYIYGQPARELTISAMIGHPKLQWHELRGSDGSLDEAFADSFARCGLVGMGRPIVAKWNGYSVGSVLISGVRLLSLCAYVRSF